MTDDKNSNCGKGWRGGGPSGAVYGLGFIGALVYKSWQKTLRFGGMNANLFQTSESRGKMSLRVLSTLENLKQIPRAFSPRKFITSSRQLRLGTGS
jgi:hypothetical protein